jgi:hypothetical protein
MAFNLIRNSRVFWTSNVNTTTGAVLSSGFLPANTREIQVLDGFSFSQNTTSETVTLNEAGATPVRGQRSFNTALDPADFTFTTYMRPQDAGTTITCEESVLWNAMFSDKPIGDAAAAWTDGANSATAVLTNSNKHQLHAFGLIIVVDDTTFIIDNCVLNTATIDFGLDAIASVQWAGQGGVLRQITSPTVTANANLVTGGALGGTLQGTFLQKVTTCPYIANKLSVVTLDEEIGSGGTAYNVALTGGSLTISNNVTYLTPANLATVNKPVTYFTSTRAISGSLNAYLRTGSGNTAVLMQSMLNNSATAVNPAFYMNISIGGTGTTKVDFTMPAVVLTIPTVNAEQVVSTTINFTAQGSTSNAFDIGAANELTVTYTTPQV